MTAFLALDSGTTASKAAVFDHRGRLLGMGRAAVRTRFGPGGAARQDPGELEAGMRRAIRDAMAASGHPHLEAAGIASQRSTFVVWDRRTHRPCGAAPTWQSTEAASLCDAMAADAARVRRVTGLPLSPHYSASKLARWLGRDRPLRRAAARGGVLFGSVATWLLWRLSEGRVHATDPTLAARSLLFDIRRLAWDPWLLDRFGVPVAMMPELRPSLAEYGTIRVGRRDVPVRAVLGDQQAALLGVLGLDGLEGRGKALANFGTGAFVLIPTGSRLVRRDGLLSSLAWTRAGSRAHVLEGTVNAAGAAVDWLRRELRLPPGLPAIDRLCRQSRADVHVIPAFWGIGSAFPSGPDATPAVIASAAGAPWSRADLAAGTVASIAHAIGVCVRLAGREKPPARLVATGPLARLRHLTECLADVIGVPVQVPPQAEATLAGIALAASGGALPPVAGRGGTLHVAPASRREKAARAHEAWLSLARATRGWPGREGRA